ncbi:hypothetical protein HETIRDRAFT_101802 [Heterobasidion irregulare TC 32-1]|uniref:Uncharacterized protein n=1 Tax=Heterobasidion irregulare (strain TC 32-1) TaxID=747525 RepID=W4K6I7_HETIT|nr:uncharacterized protein HETIRDRAFT_101802 [Heterobasidion irregulare TC 32-1]ETW80681.1 hypothetical protein HETIRDRAFT_101802 [Heterobasidion irregulare TC 32-1]
MGPAGALPPSYAATSILLNLTSVCRSISGTRITLRMAFPKTKAHRGSDAAAPSVSCEAPQGHERDARCCKARARPRAVDTARPTAFCSAPAKLAARSIRRSKDRNRRSKTPRRDEAGHFAITSVLDAISARLHARGREICVRAIVGTRRRSAPTQADAP